MSSSQSRRLSQGRHQAGACGLAGTVDRGGEADRSGGHSREARPDAIGQGSKAEATNRVPRPSRGRSTARMNPTVMAAAAAPNKMSRKALLPELWLTHDLGVVPSPGTIDEAPFALPGFGPA